MRCHRKQVWKLPKFWFFLVISTFSINLLIAIVTLERHTFGSHPQWNGPSTMKMSSVQKRRDKLPKAEFATERRLWHRILIQQESNMERNTSTLCKGQNISMTNDDQCIIKPFGFPETVREYVRRREQRNETNSLTIPPPNNQSSTTFCRAPPSEPLCDSFKYTVVMISSGRHNKSSQSSHAPMLQEEDNPHGNWRKLVVQIMKFLSYPSVERVNLILHDKSEWYNTTYRIPNRINADDTSTVKHSLLNFPKDNKYAMRLLKWSQTGTIHLISTPSLWEALDQVHVPSDAVLWIDGDRALSQNTNRRRTFGYTNGTELKSRFRTWRMFPNAFVIPKNEIQKLREIERNNHDANMMDNSECLFPFLHGIMMHANYLCYLNHPIVGSDLREYTRWLRTEGFMEEEMKNTKNTGRGNKIIDPWEVTKIAIGLLLFSLGEAYILEDTQHASTGEDEKSLHQSPASEFSSPKSKLFEYFGCSCSGEIIPNWKLPMRQRC